VNAVEAFDVHKWYGPVHAVRGVSLTVERGEILAILGPNGAGKTSLLEMLEGFRARSDGTISVLGVDPTSRRHQTWLRDRIGVVLQDVATDHVFTVSQVLARHRSLFSRSMPLDEVLDTAGLWDLRDRRAKHLSVGQRRRLDIAVGIVGRPQLLFLDEPTTGLDPDGRRSCWALIRRLADQGTTVILTSHYMDEVEALAGRVIVLRQGEVVATGSPVELAGRARRRACIRFRLPPGTSPSQLPVPADSIHDRVVTITTDRELACLQRLLSWSQDEGSGIEGLTVSRPSLEDIYLELTGAEASLVAR
jgi:ABC-2 type transport system ATP-binding protein